MPQADLRYTPDLEINPEAILTTVAEVIGGYDSGAGACKGRAWRADGQHYTNILLTVGLLAKPHRDAHWTEALLTALETAIHPHLCQECHLAIRIDYMDAGYHTSVYHPEL